MPTRWTVLAARALCATAAAITYAHLTAGRTGAALLAGTATVGAWLVVRYEQGDLTRMSKPNKRRFRLSEIRETQARKTGSEIEIETDDGSVFVIPAPGFWPDEATELMGQNKEIALATALLGGAEEYARFKQAGGRSNDVALAISAFAADQGVTEGESSASSGS